MSKPVPVNPDAGYKWAYTPIFDVFASCDATIGIIYGVLWRRAHDMRNGVAYVTMTQLSRDTHVEIENTLAVIARLIESGYIRDISFREFSSSSMDETRAYEINYEAMDNAIKCAEIMRSIPDVVVSVKLRMEAFHRSVDAVCKSVAELYTNREDGE
jgi:hypothetical protein